MNIIYVHHGHRKKGTPPTQNDDLTELGYKDCELTAELLNNPKIKSSIKAIYTSPFFRCKKTAEIINKHLELPIIEDDRLNEFRSFENETWTDCQNRIISLIDEIIQKFNKDDSIICITSGVNIGAFIVRSFNLKPSEKTPFLGVPSCSPISFQF